MQHKMSFHKASNTFHLGIKDVSLSRYLLVKSDRVSLLSAHVLSLSALHSNIGWATTKGKGIPFTCTIKFHEKFCFISGRKLAAFEH